MQQFKQNFQPSARCYKVSEELIKKFKDKISPDLIEIWNTTGLGSYNEGLIQFIHPDEYADILELWLGRKMENYVPFALTGFGELLYYRKLNEEEEDVCMIDIQFRKVEVLTWSMKSFLHDFLADELNRADWLRESLFKQAILEKGSLEKGEVFTFVPILSFGCGLSTDYLEKGNAKVYQDLVFQMTS